MSQGFMRIFFNVVFLTAVSTANGSVQDQTFPCDAVYTHAELTANITLLSVNLFSSQAMRRCDYVIGLRPKFASNEVKEVLKKAEVNLRYLRYYASYYADEDKLGEDDHQKFPKVVKEIAENFTYLLAVPGLEDGVPPIKLQEIVDAQRTLFQRKNTVRSPQRVAITDIRIVDTTCS